jgi:RNA polymerase sigma-70 factor, ECF subfamily
LAIHQRRHTYSCKVPITAWIYAIAKYKWVDYLREQQKSKAFDSLDAAHETIEGLDPHAPWQAKRDLQALTRNLPAKQANAISWIKLQGYSVQEAASMASMSEVAMRVCLHRAIKNLTKLVKIQNEKPGLA